MPCKKFCQQPETPLAQRLLQTLDLLRSKSPNERFTNKYTIGTFCIVFLIPHNLFPIIIIFLCMFCILNLLSKFLWLFNFPDLNSPLQKNGNSTIKDEEDEATIKKREERKRRIKEMMQKLYEKGSLK